MTLSGVTLSAQTFFFEEVKKRSQSAFTAQMAHFSQKNGSGNAQGIVDYTNENGPKFSSYKMVQDNNEYLYTHIMIHPPTIDIPKGSIDKAL